VDYSKSVEMEWVRAERNGDNQPELF